MATRGKPATIDSSKPRDAATVGANIATILRSKDEQIAALSEQVAAPKHQLEWLRREIFGQESERFIAKSNPEIPAAMKFSSIIAPW